MDHLVGVPGVSFFSEGSENKRKRVAVIGCTGSVGSSVLDVCLAYPEKFQVTALAASTGRDTLPRLCAEFSPRTVALSAPRNDLPGGVKILTGDDALLRLVELEDVDHVAVASSGVAAVSALLHAIKLGKEISLANKESALIVGNSLAQFVRIGQLRPLDSEHNALWQCLAGENYNFVEKLILTASGGPFLRTPIEKLNDVTPEQAAAHPVWSMGKKISVDSATLINKGIELLEAQYLFGIQAEKIFPVIHPGSKIHGLVSFIDGTTKLLMSPPDMRLAALLALSWPERLPQKMKKIEPIGLNDLNLHFEEPGRDRFPGLFTAIDAAKAGEPYPVILIAADEAAVHLFLENKIKFTDIAPLVAEVLDGYNGGAVYDVPGRAALYERCRLHTFETVRNGRWKVVWN